MDGKDWIRVVDHSKYLCRSWQRLHFEQRVVKFIRIVGVHNTVNRVFHAVALETLYTQTPFKLKDRLLVPSQNVATEALSAFVIEGVSRTRNSLINGDVRNYDWDSGYTCHQIGHGAIVVQLAQPYYVDSMRMLLWDCDDRAYSYTVEVSLDNNRWVMIKDNSNVPCRSWQLIRFALRPVTFIRIIGTKNTANEVFHLVHFECPADKSKITELKSSDNEPFISVPDHSPQELRPSPQTDKSSPGIRLNLSSQTVTDLELDTSPRTSYSRTSGSVLFSANYVPDGKKEDSPGPEDVWADLTDD